ncbi:MAG: hypothetical protein ACXADH_17300 [Candidatus Kariarchaeaceae archaeon]
MEDVSFTFKVVVILDEAKDLNDFSEDLYSKVRLGNLDPNAPLCVGTKHYMINDTMVSMLVYAIDSHRKRDWVKPGVHAFMKYKGLNSFKSRMFKTAQRLHEEYLYTKTIFVN